MYVTKQKIIVMAKNVAGDVLQKNYALQIKFNELYRQINQNEGYPFDFEKLISHLQNAVNGKFELVVMDQQDQYKESLKKFFKEVFTIKPKSDFYKKKLVLAEDAKDFMYVPADLTAQTIYEAEKRIVPDSWKYMDGVVDDSIKSQQERPTGDYWIRHANTDEPDTAYRNKSYNMYSVDGGTYMTIKEYLLCRLYAYWLKKTIWDKKGFTLTTTLDSGGCVMCGFYDVRRFRLCWCGLDYRDSDSGPRSVMIF